MIGNLSRDYDLFVGKITGFFTIRRKTQSQSANLALWDSDLAIWDWSERFYYQVFIKFISSFYKLFYRWKKKHILKYQIDTLELWRDTLGHKLSPNYSVLRGYNLACHFAQIRIFV